MLNKNTLDVKKCKANQKQQTGNSNVLACFVLASYTRTHVSLACKFVCTRMCLVREYVNI